MLYRTSTLADGNMSFHIGDTTDSLFNRKQFLVANNITFQNHVCMKCDHGEKISPIDWTNSSDYFGATTQEGMILSEVLVTQEKGLALMLLTADCLPVSLYDPVTETIALAHFSRETIAKALPQKTIDFLQKNFSVEPKNLIIKIGPHIHTDSYSFPLPQPDLHELIQPFTTKTDTHIFIDLVSACTKQLVDTGITSQNISVSTIDTAVSPDHFSYYQNKRENSIDGRFATILMM